MELIPQDDVEKVIARALDAFAAGEIQSALAQLERAFKTADDPLLHSYLGFCIAKERGQFRKGRDLCLESIELEPENPVHYLNLAKVHQVAGDKSETLSALRKGMSVGGSEEIASLLARLGNRRPPPIAFLPRDNPLNKWLGILLGRLGLR